MCLLGQLGLAGLAASLKSTGQAVLRRDTVDTVGRVEVLHNDHLVAGSHTFAGSDDGPGEEKLPNLLRVRIDDLDERIDHGGLTLYQRLPYLALIASKLPTQLRYHLQRVPE